MLVQQAAYCAGRLLKSWGVSTLQGRRPDQEDRYSVVTRIPGRDDLAFFGVFDGHGGAECAKYAAARMHTEVAVSPALRQGAVGKALVDAFARVEEGFLEIAHRHQLSSGTTALAAVLRVPGGDGDAGEVTIAHVGDSRGVLCRGKSAVALTVDHKPDNEDERRRIERAGGFVAERAHCARVQGVLAMSRALGNRLLKPFVSATPTVATVPLTADDKFIVLASDGLYDVFEDQAVVDIALESEDPQGAQPRRGGQGRRRRPRP